MILTTLVLAGFSLATAPIAQACACGGFVASDGERVTSNAEYAVLSLDGNRERLLLSMNARTVTKDAALLIPTPAPAEASLAERNLFGELKAATAPRREVDYTWWPDSGDGAAGAPVGSAGGSHVDVLKNKRLGPLEVTSLAADDAGKLAGWLKAHDYVMSDAMAEALRPYVVEGWYYTAIKLTTDGKNLSGALQPLDLTFPSESLVYPMRLSRAAPGPQFVRTYVFADHEVTRTDRTSERADVSTYFAGRLPDSAITAESTKSIIAENPYLTVIDTFISQPKREIVSDFTFERADEDRPYRQVIHETRMRTILGVPAGPALTAIGILMIAGTAMVFVARVRRRGRTSS